MHTAESILSALLTATPRPTTEAPRDARGIYGLVNHEGQLSYIGSTKATDENFRKRIHARHRTGSENSSHYFSRMYNTGRMWRDRNDPATKTDGDIAKELRNAFIAEHCRAVWVPLPDHLDIAGLEAEVIAIAPAEVIAWNRRGTETYAEPVALVDQTLVRLGWPEHKLAAIERQRQRAAMATAPAVRPGPAPLPSGPCRFFALDVETANNNRASICQIGIACVRHDGTVETWSSYVDPETNDWSCTFVHGITADKVRGAPRFAEIIEQLDIRLAGRTVYQHSSFDRSAIESACSANDLATPNWGWQDSVQVARRAWPELKGNGGHGLSALKSYLGLSFRHHDAGEDARASAEIVLLAEAGFKPSQQTATSTEDDDILEPYEEVVGVARQTRRASTADATPQFGMVPVASDGTCFHPDLARRGVFTIGAKGAEMRIASFEDALAELQRMEKPRWRRPNSAGNWGIVSGCGWKKMG